MKSYNDCAMMNECEQTMAQSEYDRLTKSHIFSIDKAIDDKNLFDKIAYLLSLIPVLRQHNKSQEIHNVLSNIKKRIKLQTEMVKKFFDESTKAYLNNLPDTKIFCNNLKLSIQTCLEITSILASFGMECQNREQKEKMKTILDDFFEITKKYVSLFGECEYRVYLEKYEK